MKVLVVENYAETGLGQIREVLDEAGAEIDRRSPYLGEALPTDASGHDALIVLGGGQNALDDGAYPYFPALLDLIRDFEARDRSVLGICLGSQLMARAFGGINQVGGATEFGWQTVTLTADGQADPVAGSAPSAFSIFQWHDDTFGLPERAVRLAESAKAVNQAFRVGRAAYATQFHFEADTKLVEQWTTLLASQIEANNPDWPERRPQEQAVHGAEADAAGKSLARAWVGTIRPDRS